MTDLSLLFDINKSSGPQKHRVRTVKTFTWLLFRSKDFKVQCLRATQRIELARGLFAGEPFGKAGAYGIQGPAGAWVKRIEGCYFNVMGFPLHDFAAQVADLLQNGRLQLR